MSTRVQLDRFEFDGYTLRPVGESDRALLQRFINSEPSHAGRVTPDFYIGNNGYALEDKHGYVLLYMRTEVAARIHMDFGEAETLEERQRMGSALKCGFEWLAAKLSMQGFAEINFDSEAPLLRLFATHRLGFQAAPNDLRRTIAPLRITEVPQEDWRGAPQSAEGSVQ